MVFRYPLDPSTDYIKRVVGLPGDEVSFHDQKLYHQRPAGAADADPGPDFYDEDTRSYQPEFTETLGTTEHLITINPQSTPFVRRPEGHQFPFQRKLPLQCRRCDVQGSARATTS